VATLTFDKLAYVDRLKGAGMDERQARALADGLDQALREEVATKTDVAAVGTELAALRHKLTGEIVAVRQELKGEIAAVRQELKGEIAAVRQELKSGIAAVRHELKGDIGSVKHDLLRWMVGMAFAQVGLTVALIRFLPH
jgi:predicted  nucleic acid-binding Zn-ribbon protein